MKIRSRATLVLSVFLPLTVACNTMPSSEGDSTSQSQQESKPIAQDEVPPIKDSGTSGQEDRDAGSQPLEAPSPGVPVDDRTYREMKERAKDR